MAITDDVGSHVTVVGDGIHIMSQPLQDHAAAIALADQVYRHGTWSYDKWRKPYNLVEALFALGA